MVTIFKNFMADAKYFYDFYKLYGGKKSISEHIEHVVTGTIKISQDYQYLMLAYQDLKNHVENGPELGKYIIN
jgi:hypothetical protein